MKQHRTINLMLALFFSVKLTAVEMTITQPGMYKLGGNLTIAPAATDTIISIQASDVTLDLGGYIISQSNLTSNVDGIQIANGLSDVFIMNGTIRGVSRFGINSGTSLSRLMIENINFENCALRAISVDGGSFGTVNRDVAISHCNFFNCCETASTGTIVHLGFSNGIQFSDSWIGRFNNGQNGLVSVITCTNVESCDISHIKVSEGTAQRLTIFDLSGFNGSSLSNTMIENNIAFFGPLIGLSLSNSSSGNFFNEVFISQNIAQSTLGAMNMINILGGSFNVFANFTITQNLSSGGFVGFNMAATNSNFNTFFGCSLLGNQDSLLTGTLRGFWLQQPANSSTIVNCSVINNINLAAPGTTAVGIDISGITANATLMENYVIRNSGQSAATSFGIRVPTSPNNTGNLLSKNMSYANGTNSANQFFNVPAATVPAAPATSNMNATTIPAWTNVAVAA